MSEERCFVLQELCRQYTDLNAGDIAFLADLAGQLPFVSELNDTDIFIDALTNNSVDAIVLAWARPRGRSLYGHSVVGEIAYATREPAVYQTFSNGEAVRGVRGISQEGVPIAQTVVPIRNKAGKIIGVLIMEKDISDELRQEEQVEFLSQTAERLSSTLMSLSMTCFSEDWWGNGIFVLNHRGEITYANKIAAGLYRKHYKREPLRGDLFSVLSCHSLREMLEALKEPVEFNFGDTSYLFQAHPLVTCGEISGCVVSLRDVTELRRKEKQLSAQSAIIREIHHRVKNNLQNVVALLRLQMHRSESPLVQTEFEACINRILSIASVHEVFAHQNWDSIDLLELADHILSKLVETFAAPGQKIKTAVQGKSVRLPSSQAVPMALVINELVSNSLKHGIQKTAYGEISIFVEESGRMLNILVVDSGNGLEPAAEPRRRGPLGLYIVNLLICEQLGGSFMLERRSGSTVARVSFRLDQAEEIS